MKRRSFLGGVVASLTALIPGASLFAAVKPRVLFDTKGECRTVLMIWHYSDWTLKAWVYQCNRSIVPAVTYTLSYRGDSVSVWDGEQFAEYGQRLQVFTSDDLEKVRKLDHWDLFPLLTTGSGGPVLPNILDRSRKLMTKIVSGLCGRALRFQFHFHDGQFDKITEADAAWMDGLLRSRMGSWIQYHYVSNPVCRVALLESYRRLAYDEHVYVPDYFMDKGLRFPGGEALQRISAFYDVTS